MKPPADDGGALDAEFLARLSELNDRFAAALPQTLQRLSAAHAAFDPQQPSPALVDDLHVILHSLAGSAATFGFGALGDSARMLEQRLSQLAAAGAVPPAAWADWLAALHDFIEAAERGLNTV